MSQKPKNAPVMDMGKVRSENVGEMTVDELLLILLHRTFRYSNTLLPLVHRLIEALDRKHVADFFIKQKVEEYESMLGEAAGTPGAAVIDIEAAAGAGE